MVDFHVPVACVISRCAQEVWDEHDLWLAPFVCKGLKGRDNGKVRNK